MSARVLGNKYHNIKTDGYDSKAEARKAAELSLLQDAGIISDLAEQVEFELLPKQNPIYPRGLVYRADFVFFTKEGKRVILDVTGYKTAIYVLKKRLMKQLLGLDILEEWNG